MSIGQWLTLPARLVRDDDGRILRVRVYATMADETALVSFEPTREGEDILNSIVRAERYHENSAAPVARDEYEMGVNRDDEEKPDAL